VLAHCAAASHAAPISVFVMAGQSNMVGGATDPVSPGLSPQPDILYQYRLQTRVTPTVVRADSEDWGPLRSLAGEVAGVTWGADLAFGQEMSRRLSTPVAILKVAANGTGLAVHWLPTIQDGLYPWMLEKVNTTMGQLTAEGYQPTIAGFVWVQGEGDANTLAIAQAYDDNLATLAQHVRADFGVANLPFLINEAHIDLARTYTDELRASQRAAAAADPNMYIINADDLALGPDSVHFTGAMYNEVGRRFADLLVPSADFDFDGVVNNADLAVWRGSVGVDRAGDGNSDGVTDGADFLLWQRQLAAAAGAGVATAIPEPGARTLLWLAATVLLIATRMYSR
jgi:hypothetical protein